MKTVKSAKCPGPGWVRVSRPCEYGSRGSRPCRRRGLIRWNAWISPPGSRRRKVLPGEGILVCRKCATALEAQLKILTLCVAARDGKRIAQMLWGAP